MIFEIFIAFKCGIWPKLKENTLAAKAQKIFLIFSVKISNFKGEKILLGVGRSLFGYIFCDNLPSET